MYLLSARNNQETGKPDHGRNSAHGKSNKHANDNVPHDIHFNLKPAKHFLHPVCSSQRPLQLYTGSP